MGTAVGGGTPASPGGSADDQTAQAAASSTPADLTSQNEPQPGKSDTVARSEYEKSVLAERNLRARLKVFEDEKTAAEQAALSDAQKLTKQLEKAQEQLDRYKGLYAETLVKFEAKEQGYANADIGAALVLKDLVFGDDGVPTNAKELLSARLKTDSYLGASASVDDGKQQPPTVANLGATNGGGSKAGTPTLDDFRKGKLSMTDAARMWQDGSMARMLDAEREKNRR